jgi:hypothetical protein
MFENRIIAFARHYLSTRTFELIVEPALADLHYDEECGRRSIAANRVAVLRAVAGGLCDELRRDAGSFFTVALVPTGYYLFMMTVCLDAFRTWGDFFGAAAVVLVMSFFPVVVCFWPRRASLGADAPAKAAASLAD